MDSSQLGHESIQGGIFSGEVDFKKPLDLAVVKGKTILITGGASGIGAACATLWAKHGANLMIGDVNTKLGTDLVADLRKTTQNEHHHFFTCDVTNWQSQAIFFKEAASRSPHGGIDVVMANAGIADALEGDRFENPPDYSKIENPSEPKILRTIDINLKGVYFTTHLALSYLVRNPGSQSCAVDQKFTQRDRQLILVSSVAGFMPIVRVAPYCSAKHGVVGLFRTLRITAPMHHGIRVNMINPYFVKTPMTKLGGEIAVAGGSMSKIDDVVDVLTRYVTDPGIIGRGCVIGPQGSNEDARLAILPHGGPVWDVYADDFGQTDVFTRRIIALTNIQAQARGWTGAVRDILVALASPIFGRFMG